MKAHSARLAHDVSDKKIEGGESRLSMLWHGVKETLIVAGLATAFSIFYLMSFTLNRQIFAREIIFYDALLVLGLCVGFLILLWLGGAFKRLNRRNVPARLPLAILLFVFMGYSFAITVPGLINRSVSFFMISKVVESGPNGATAEQMQTSFINDYVIEFGAIPRRLSEQLATGNFRQEGDRFVATERGVMVYRIYTSFLTAFRTSEDYRAIDGAD